MSVSNSKALTLTALWTLYGAGTLFAGVTRKLRPLRFLGLLLLAGATVEVRLSTCVIRSYPGTAEIRLSSRLR